MTVYNIDLDLTEDDVLTIEFLALEKSEDPDYGPLFIKIWNEISGDVPYFPVLGDFVQYELHSDLATWIEFGVGGPLLRVEAIIGDDVLLADGWGQITKVSALTANFRIEERTSGNYLEPDYEGLGNGTYHDVEPLTIETQFNPEEDDGSGWFLDDSNE